MIVEPNWAEINAPWWQSYALWLERGEVAPCYRVKASIGSRQLLVALNRKSVRIDVVDHDWRSAFVEARGRLEQWRMRG